MINYASVQKAVFAMAPAPDISLHFSSFARRAQQRVGVASPWKMIPLCTPVKN